MSWWRIYKIIILLLFTSLVVKAQYPGMLKTFNEYSNRLDGKLTGEVYYMTSIANSNFFLQKDWVDGLLCQIKHCGPGNPTRLRERR